MTGTKEIGLKLAGLEQGPDGTDSKCARANPRHTAGQLPGRCSGLGYLASDGRPNADKILIQRVRANRRCNTRALLLHATDCLSDIPCHSRVRSLVEQMRTSLTRGTWQVSTVQRRRCSGLGYRRERLPAQRLKNCSARPR